MFGSLSDGVRRELGLMGWGPRAFDGGIARLVQAMRLQDRLRAAPDLTALFGQLSQMEAAWFYYFLDSLRRGDRLVAYAGDRVQPGKRFLDVGCGYGGALVAGHQRGLKVHGIEIEERALAGARALLAERDVPGWVEPIDILEPSFDAVPAMDIITCENVIEHVDDPRAFMLSMARKLTRDGVLVMEIPNATALRSVAADPHYGLPFLSLVSHATARAVFDAVVERDVCNEGYSVGDYFPLPWYVDILSQETTVQSVRARADALASIADAHAILDQLTATRARLPEIYQRAAPLHRERIGAAADAYLSKLRTDLETAPGSPQGIDLSNQEADFATRYLSAAWIVTTVRAPR